MRLLLDFVYLIACIIASPWLVYRLCVSGRRDFAARFGFGLGSSLPSCVWLHGSSAGEIAVLRTLVAALERDHPETPLVISAFTATGLTTARKLYPRHRIVPLPVDLSFVVTRFFKRFNPRLLVVAESEFWPNLFRVAHNRGVPAALVNGKMSAKSFRVHARTGLVPSVLAKFALLAVQTAEHAQRLRALGVPEARLHVTGNMKYDLTETSAGAERGRELRAALGFAPTDVVLIGGSLHDQEDEALLDAYAAARAANGDTALIIVPRYPADAIRRRGARARARLRSHAQDRRRCRHGDAARPQRRAARRHRR